jgi:hypothetical protein
MLQHTCIQQEQRTYTKGVSACRVGRIKSNTTHLGRKLVSCIWTIPRSVHLRQPTVAHFQQVCL